MAIVKTNAFDGGSGLTDGTLSAMIRSISQFQSKTKANAIAALTDNGGGAAADGTVGAISQASATPLTGDTCPTKAEVETNTALIKDALTELGAKIVSFAAVVPAVSPTNSIGGTAADGTIAAIANTSTGAAGGGGTCVAKAGFNTFVVAASYLLAEMARDTNKLAVACGVTPLVVSAMSTLTTYDEVYSALTSTTGSAAANGTTSITQAEYATICGQFRDAVKEISTKLNALRDASLPVPSYVAG